ncbi:MAG: hypothetical protein ACLTFL_17785 [Bacteroides thetaiotaomicron]
METDCITASNPPPFGTGILPVIGRHPGLPVCHRAKGVGSLIPRPSIDRREAVRASSKLGQDGLSETTRERYGKSKTGT